MLSVGLIVFLISFLFPLLFIWPLRLKRVITFGDRQQIGFVFSSMIAIAVMLSVQSLGGRTTVMMAIMLGLCAAIMNYYHAIQRTPFGIKGGVVSDNNTDSKELGTANNLSSNHR